MDFEKVKHYKKVKYTDLSFDLLKNPKELEAYLYSGSIFRLNYYDLESLISALRKSYPKKSYELLFDFINFSFSTADMYWSNAQEYAKELCAEDILSQAEFLGARMLAKNISVDGKQYNDDIINSQHDFLLGVIPTLIRFIKENEIEYCRKQSNVKKHKSTKVIEYLSHYHSTISHLNEVLKGYYSVESIDFLCKKYSIDAESKNNLSKCLSFFMNKSPEGFELLETYRDLNYRLESREENNLEVQMDLMRKSGFGKYDKDIDLLHFDFAKGDAYETELYFNKVGNFLEQIYSSVSTSFSYRGRVFKISDLLYLCKLIYNLANWLNKRNLNNLRKKKSSFISIKGKKSLTRALGLNKQLEILIDLFAADSYKEIENSPFLFEQYFYYVFPQHIVELCFEKVIDKILSNREIKLELPKGIKKGHLFEERILDLFSSAGLESFALKGNSNKGVPEIDAIVSFDDSNVLVIEAKCSVKPESRFEAFVFIENHLQKAKQQLALRVNYLRTNSENSGSNNFPFSLLGKNITPIIVTNHSYFTGMKFRMSDEITVYCIDEFLLRKIIEDRIIPSWTYLPRDNSYALDEIKLISSHEVINAIKNPVSFLNGMVGKTIQILESGIAFEISKHARINWEYKYKNEINRLS